MWRTLVLWSLWVLTASTAGLQAQEAANPGPYRLEIKVPLVLVDVSVVSRKTGEPLRGLGASDFEIAEDGAPQQVLSVSEDTLPVSLLFLFDLTDSVHPVLQHLADGAAAALRHLRPEDEVAVMTFSSHARLEQRFTRDRITAVEGIDAASASYDEHEPTFLFEDLWQAAKVSESSRVAEARRVQVWVTDGSANDQVLQRGLANQAPAQLHTEAEATAALARSEAVVSALVERSGLKGSGRFGDVERLADATGGPVVYVNASDAAYRLATLLDTLRARYTVAYRPKQAKPAGTVCRLQVGLSTAFRVAHPEIKVRDLAVRARQSYVRSAERMAP